MSCEYVDNENEYEDEGLDGELFGHILVIIIIDMLSTMWSYYYYYYYWYVGSDTLIILRQMNAKIV